MPFYEYRQNNTGGSFDVDHMAGISASVVVEANNSGSADERAANLGLYFDGCDDNQDCACCGDRWYRAYGDGDQVASHYGEPVESADMDYRWIKDGPELWVHYADGSREGFPKL
jgi:hypothetical protein